MMLSVWAKGHIMKDLASPAKKLKYGEPTLKCNKYPLGRGGAFFSLCSSRNFVQTSVCTGY